MIRSLLLLLILTGCTITPEHLGETGEFIQQTGQVVQTAIPGPWGAILSAIGGIITAVAASRGYSRYKNRNGGHNKLS